MIFFSYNYGFFIIAYVRLLTCYAFFSLKLKSMPWNFEKQRNAEKYNWSQKIQFRQKNELFVVLGGIIDRFILLNYIVIVLHLNKLFFKLIRLSIVHNVWYLHISKRLKISSMHTFSAPWRCNWSTIFPVNTHKMEENIFDRSLPRSSEWTYFVRRCTKCAFKFKHM